MRLVLDADGLIKLNRAKVLGQVVYTYQCVIPQAAYHEAVTLGKLYLHQDAEEIEQTIGAAVQVVSRTGKYQELGLGAGESAVLALAAETNELIVVSDDRRFLNHLLSVDIPFLTPVDLLVLMAHQKHLAQIEAEEALERLRPAIRTASYWAAKEDLEHGGQNEE